MNKKKTTNKWTRPGVVVHVEHGGRPLTDGFGNSNGRVTAGYVGVKLKDGSNGWNFVDGSINGYPGGSVSAKVGDKVMVTWEDGSSYGLPFAEPVK